LGYLVVFTDISSKPRTDPFVGSQRHRSD